MRLKHITFTGVDDQTDIRTLQDIQKRWPIAEFGILTSYDRASRGNRYPSPAIFDKILNERGGLNLSLHLCGDAAHDAAVGLWDLIEDLTDTDFSAINLRGPADGNLHLFKRIQLNLAGRKDNPQYCYMPRIIGQEIIIQIKNAENTGLYRRSKEKWRMPLPSEKFSMLIDPSGGRGISSDIEVVHTNDKIGYAGGINPENVERKLRFLLNNVTLGEFWIDMETGVRTDDRFDTEKVVRVLETCDRVLKDYNDH